MRLLKVIIWNTNFLRDGGGSQKVAYFFAKDLHEHGLLPTVVCNNASKQRTNPAFGALPSQVTLYQDSFVNPWDSSRNPFHFIFHMFVYLGAAIRFIYFFRKERFSLIHLNYVSWDIWLLALCKYIFRVPLVISFLGGETNLATQSKLTRIKVKLALRVADKVTAVSKSFCDELDKEFGFVNVFHVPFYRDPSQLLNSKLLMPSVVEEDHFVFCGRISQEKRVPFLIEAFKEATIQGCSRKLYIIGEGEDQPECRELVKTLNIQEQVIFLGCLPYQVVQQIISKCRSLILCSRTESNPQVVLEAMSFEKTVICSLLPGVEQIVIHEETGLLFEMTRKDLLVELISRVSADKDYCQKLGRAAGVHLKALFSKQCYTKQMVALYSELCSIDYS